jgi:hypothetical protein
MTPKEKANALIKKMLSKSPNIQDGVSIIDTIQAKLCAIIAIDEIIQELEYLKHTEDCNEDVFDSYQYYEKVKLELEKL